MVGKVVVLAVLALAASGAYTLHRRGERIIFRSTRADHSMSPLLALAVFVYVFIWALVTWLT